MIKGGKKQEIEVRSPLRKEVLCSSEGVSQRLSQCLCPQRGNTSHHHYNRTASNPYYLLRPKSYRTHCLQCPFVKYPKPRSSLTSTLLRAPVARTATGPLQHLPNSISSPIPDLLCSSLSRLVMLKSILRYRGLLGLLDLPLGSSPIWPLKAAAAIGRICAGGVKSSAGHAEQRKQ